MIQYYKKPIPIIAAMIAVMFLCGCKDNIRSIELLNHHVNMNVGDTYQLAYIANGANKTPELTWTSSDPHIVTVDEDGLLLALAAGSAMVTVEVDGHSDTCSVDVTPGTSPYASDVNITSYGAVNSHFSVSPGEMVQFSRGNLQYQPSSGLWQFAENQFQYIGRDNANASATYNGWIDLFGWGTSGWNGGIAAYEPWATSTDDTQYQLGNATANITETYALGDWGLYNSIENGGRRQAMWRTLTQEEWAYLLTTDTNNHNRYGKWGLATIADIYRGIVIVPDTWTKPTDVDYSHGSAHGYRTNRYTYQEWLSMQASGAVFLPNAGQREGTTTSALGADGYYWSSTADGATAAYALFLVGGTVNATASRARHSGLSVRLVSNY